MSLLARFTLSAASFAPQMRGMASKAGIVKWFNTTKGFGFIAPKDGTGPDAFVHQTSINCTGYRYLKEGEEVSYDVAKTDRGLSATNVSAPDGSPLIREDNRGPV